VSSALARARWRIAPRGSRHTAVLSSASGSPDRSAVRSRRHHRVQHCAQANPLGAHSSPRVAVRRRPGRAPARHCRRRPLCASHIACRPLICLLMHRGNARTPPRALAHQYKAVLPAHARTPICPSAIGAAAANTLLL
jgi:hypothetical protein